MKLCKSRLAIFSNQCLEEFGIHEKLAKFKTHIVFVEIQQKKHYKYRCKIAQIQLRAEGGTEGLVCVRSTVVGNS